MNHHNPYARIQEYFSLLSASMDYTDRSDNGISMQQICENTQIPAKIVRNDFLTIFQWQRSMNLVKNSDKNELPFFFMIKAPNIRKSAILTRCMNYTIIIWMPFPSMIQSRNLNS